MLILGRFERIWAGDVVRDKSNPCLQPVHRPRVYEDGIKTYVVLRLLRTRLSVMCYLITESVTKFETR